MRRLPGENVKKIFFFELLPFVNLVIENLMSQKVFIAPMSFKLGQLIEDNE